VLEKESSLSIRRLAGLAVAVAILWLFWDTRYVYPLRILLTFFHETSHGLAAVLTGGRIDKITIQADGSGLCYTLGGWRWVILPAGYLGSMLWGCLLLILACRSRHHRFVSMGLGAGLLILTLCYVRSRFGFGMGLAVGAALASVGLWLPEQFNEAMLVFIGMASCLYSLFDVRTLMKLGRSVPNDAAMFSKEILPLPPVVWATIWGLIALGALGLALRVALGGTEDTASAG